MVGERFKHGAEESRGGQTFARHNQTEERNTIKYICFSKEAKRETKKTANVKERQTAVNVIVGVQERIPLSKRNNSCNATRIAADRCQKRELT